MENFNAWFNRFRLSETHRLLLKKPVAYFCMEYALPKNLPIYAGGLGVLAGDYVIEAHKQKFPMVGIGLLYFRKNYFDRRDHISVANGYIESGLKPVTDKLGNRIKISLPVEGNTVTIQAWLYDEQTIPIYLLDVNIAENEPADRNILDLLYVGDPKSRLKQEIILGIDGVKFLNALGIEPSLYHMNEGHSALLIFELAKKFMDKGTSFDAALQKAKKKIAFTNHTLVKGGHDAFEYNLAATVLEGYANELGVNIHDLLERGIEDKDEKHFAMTHLALTSASKVNAVSELHSVAAKDVWKEQTMIPITNGVNIDRWNQIKNETDLSKEHLKNKIKLLELIKNNTGVKWDKKDLVIGWARRVVGYKRPTCLFEDLERIKRLLKNKEMPIKLVFAGYPHYSDKEALGLLNHIRELANNELRGDLVYLENYTTDLSSVMIAGCDVWLNTPVVGLEACGTSGMKAALNGTLLCSTNDGWLPEIDLQKIGFMLENEFVTISTRDMLSNIIAPVYYQNDEKNPFWLQKMQMSRQVIVENFGTDRMLKDYIEKIYEPILSE